MTDADDDDRLDLGAFGLAEDKAQADRVIAGAMSRIATTEQQSSRNYDFVPWLDDVAQWWYPGLAAAAVIALVAGATVANTPTPSDRVTDAHIESQLLDWARAGHVPTNGDLFAAFHRIPQ